MRRALPIAAALAIAVAAVWYVFTRYLPTFVTSARPLPAAACARADGDVVLPISEGRLVVLIIDGLGFDFARALPDLGWLRERGATRPLDVPYPSYTTPALLSFVTGLGPRDSGVRLNAKVATVTVGLDNLTQVAADAGRPFTLLDGGEWEPFEALMFVEGEVDHGRLARAVAPFLPRDRAMIYYGRVDEEGHRTGEASEKFRVEAERAARFAWRTALGLDLDRDILLVLSDHGHLADGGHGGAEPEIRRAFFGAIGRDVAPGERGVRPLSDVAATIAVLAGLPTPACNLGSPMLDVVHWDDGRRARALAAPFAQAAALACKLAPHPRCAEIASFLGRLGQGDVSAPAAAEALLAEVIAAREAQRDAAEASARNTRLAILAAVTLLLALVGFGWRRRLPGLAEPKTWLTPLVVVVSYAALLYARGYRLTFSKMPQRDDFLRDAAVAGVIATAIAVAVALKLLRARDADVAVLFGTLWPWLGLVAYCGADPAFVAPPYAGLAVLLLGPGVLAASLTTAILAASMPHADHAQAVRRRPEVDV